MEMEKAWGKGMMEMLILFDGVGLRCLPDGFRAVGFYSWLCGLGRDGWRVLYGVRASGSREPMEVWLLARDFSLLS